MDLREKLGKELLILDGGMGTLLQKRGMKPGESPVLWCLTHPDIITEIHKSYYDAGSNIVLTNTFEANGIRFSETELEEIIKAAVACAKEAAKTSVGTQSKYVALDVSSTGKLLKPLGTLDFEDAVEAFAQSVRFGVKYGVDCIVIETMSDSYETKAAVLAAKENSDLPILITNAYGENGRLMTGTDTASMVALLEGLGVDALGANCSLGPKQLLGVAENLVANASVPVILKPNAGLPCDCEGEAHYDITTEEFAEYIRLAVESGVTLVGGCCGTTPAYIEAVKKATENIEIKPIIKKETTVVSSSTHSVTIGKEPIIIGERINPTGKKRFKEALLANDIPYLLKEAVGQKNAGAHVLDVNVGLPNIDEPKMMKTAVEEIQGVVDLPLQIDTTSIEAMEKALRIYNGKALVNSVNGKTENMKAVFPLLKKYGGVVVALTLDENGIPETAEKRVEIAKNILMVAASYGIEKKDIIFDPLCMAVSADANCPKEILKAVEIIRNELGVNTVLGVSNISFGLPGRSTVNAAFLTSALERGLSAAIVNPYAEEIINAFVTYNLLHGFDEGCRAYIEYAADKEETAPALQTKTVTDLNRAIQKGLKEDAASLTAELLKTTETLAVINDEIIPALDEVGKGYETGRIFLPQLLMSADAAKASFDIIKAEVEKSGKAEEKKCKFVLATVKGDIHDIGKNIVKTLLENYGFDVIDLGKDVAPEVVLETVLKEKAPLCGLSALMTTTVPAMKETVKLLNEKAPFCRTVVGGAVLNEEYAAEIGADKYSKDAMQTVRYAEEIYNKKVFL